jgi:hypothetical protein
MVNRCLKALVLAATHMAVALGAGATCAAASQTGAHAATDNYQKWRTAAVATLSARADANSLATAAALRYVGTAYGTRTGVSKAGASALELVAHAGELAPQSASIGWLNLQLCADTPSCDIRDAATAMRWVDADNGAAWLLTLAAAQREKDSTEVDRVLADMAQGARFDFYWNRIVVLMVDALYSVRHELPGGFAASDSTRLTAVSGIANSEIIPPFTALVEACRESSAAPARREPCMKLSKTMQRSDTVVAQLAGFIIEKRLHAPDSKEARMIAERRHVLEWRFASASKLDSALLPWTTNARARIRLAHMRAMPREEDVCIAILREHKMALEPPEVHP